MQMRRNHLLPQWHVSPSPRQIPDSSPPQLLSHRQLRPILTVKPPPTVTATEDNTLLPLGTLTRRLSSTSAPQFHNQIPTPRPVGPLQRSRIILFPNMVHLHPPLGSNTSINSLPAPRPVPDRNLFRFWGTTKTLTLRMRHSSRTILEVAPAQVAVHLVLQIVIIIEEYLLQQGRSISGGRDLLRRGAIFTTARNICTAQLKRLITHFFLHRPDLILWIWESQILLQGLEWSFTAEIQWC